MRLLIKEKFMKNRLPRFSKKLLSLFLLKTILTGFLGVIIFEQEIDSKSVMAEKSQEETFQEKLNWTIDEKIATKNDDDALENTYVSKIQKTIYPIDLLAIDWDEEVPENTEIELFIRLFKNNVWTSWQLMEKDIDGPELPETESFIIANRSEQFQMKAVLKTFSQTRKPTLKSIKITTIYSPTEKKSWKNTASKNLAYAYRAIEKEFFDPKDIDFEKIVAGLNVISEENLNVITRKNWGADESLRLSRKSDAQLSSGTSEDPEHDDGMSEEFRVDKEDYEKFKDELKIEKTITKNEKGEDLLWPIQKAKKIRKFIIHHTATTKNLDDPAAAIRSIYYYHAVTRGWGDIGYNYIIDREGNVYEGRFGGEKVVAGHAKNNNVGSIGIAVLGNYENDDVPYPVIKSLINLIGAKALLYNIDPDGVSSFRGIRIPNVIGHRDVNDTSCPGAKLYEKIPALRKMIASSVDARTISTQNIASSQAQKEYDFEEMSERGVIEMKPNASAKVTFTLKNTGTALWDEKTFLIANQSPEASQIADFTRNAEKNSNIAFMKEKSVAQGKTATFEVDVKSFLKGGLIAFDVTPIFNGKKKLEKYLTLPIYVYPPKLTYAVYQIHSPRQNIKAGEIVKGWIKLQNTGDVTWKKDGINAIRLGTNEESVISILQQNEVKPGETAFFDIQFKAPKKGGTYTESFKPQILGVGSLKGDNDLAFTFYVEGNEFKGEFVSMTSTTNFKPGETKKIVMLLRNTGDAVWRKSGADAPSKVLIKAASIQVTNVLLRSDVSTGALGTFEWTISAPTKEGKYRVSYWPRIRGKALTKKPITFVFTVSKDKKEESKQDTIRVLLSFQGNPVITADSDFDLYSGDELVESFTMDDKVEISLEDGKYLAKIGQKLRILDNILRFVPHEGTILRIDNFDKRPSFSPNLNDNMYRGILEIREDEGKLIVINELLLEDYLRGLAEPAESDPIEKIKALVIVARTYAKFYIDSDGSENHERKFPGKPYDGSDDPDIFQRYLGYGYELRSPNLQKAIKETEGLVVTYNGEIVKTPYFSSSDGRTRSGQEVFGWTHTPYLQSVDDPYCKGMTLRGHGVGLSGCGAYGAAKDGKTAEEIIKYYYQGVELKKLY